jgi:uncharacterized protein YegJ (DUF2314 family)
MSDDNFEPFQGGLILDGIKQHKDFPDTFDIPSKDDIASVRKGDFVKVCFHHQDADGEIGGERLWVEVETNDIRSQKIVGTIGNDPVFMPHLKFGDTVVLDYRHCIATTAG